MIETKKDLKNLNFIKKMFIFAFMLIASFFVVNQQNTANIKAAEIGEPNVVIQGTYGDADPTSGEYAVTTAATTEFATPAQGRATGTKEQIIAGSTAKPIIKVTITNIDVRIDAIFIMESGMDLSKAMVATATLDPCASGVCVLKTVTNTNLVGTPVIVNTTGGNSLTFYYKLQTVTAYGVIPVTLSFSGKPYEGDNFPQEVSNSKGINVVKELVGSNAYYESDTGDFNAGNVDATYLIGARGGNMVTHTNSTDANFAYNGASSIVGNVVYSDGNTDGKALTKTWVKASFTLEKNIIPASVTITRTPLTGDTVNGGNLTITTGTTNYSFDTGEFISLSGFYQIVITDIFDYTHTLNMVVDFITNRTISFDVQYYVAEVNETNKITEKMTTHWVNVDVIMVITVSTPNQFIADDIYHNTYNGTFTFLVNSETKQFNVTNSGTNYSNDVYTFNSTDGTFVGIITIKFNESFNINFKDRFGNEADATHTETRSIKNIDKVAPVISGNSTPLAEGSTTPLMIKASKLYTSGMTHNSIFANNFLLGAAFDLHSGEYTITAADVAVTDGSVGGTTTSAGFKNTTANNENMIVKYYKADGITLIATQNGLSTDLNDDVTAELFQGREVIVVIELRDNFPLLYGTGGLLGTTDLGNLTTVKFKFTAFDDVAPIINMTGAAALSQQVQPQSTINTEIIPHGDGFQKVILSHYVTSVWDNFDTGEVVLAADFNTPSTQGNVWTFTSTRGITIKIDMSTVHNGILTPDDYAITFNATDRATATGVAAINSSIQTTATYRIDKMKVLFEFTNFSKYYGAADPSFIGVNKGTAAGYTVTGHTGTFYPALDTYGLASRALSRETTVIDSKDYQQVLPAGESYKLYQYWSNTGTTFADRQSAALTNITTCNANPSATGCSAAFVDDANHEIYFLINGAVYRALEDYYATVTPTADGRSQSAHLGLTINKVAASITPTATVETPYTTTYGSPVLGSHLGYNATGLVASTHTNVEDTTSIVFGGTLEAVDPYNVTFVSGSVDSGNFGYVRMGSLALENNTWDTQNYTFDSTAIFKTVGSIANVYTGTGSVGLSLIVINQATLTISPLTGQYKQIDYKNSTTVKAEGSHAIDENGIYNPEGSGNYGTETGKYRFTASGWVSGETYVTNDASATNNDYLNTNFTAAGLGVTFGGVEKVLLLLGTSTNENPRYDGYFYNTNDLKFEYKVEGVTYNNYKVVLHGDFTAAKNPTPEKKFVIVKAQIRITTNNFEMTYGNSFTPLLKTISGAQGTTTDLTDPAFQICRGTTEHTTTCGATALKAIGTEIVINTFEDLTAALSFSINGFGTTTLIPAGIYRIEASISASDIADNFQFTIVNDGRLTVKSREVYIGATGPSEGVYNYTKVYGDDDPTFDWGVYNAITGRNSGLVNGDTRDAAFTNTHTSILRASGEVADTYAVTNTSTITAVEATHSTPINSLTPSSLKVEGTYYNYAKVVDLNNLTGVESTLTITPKQIEVKALDITKVYGEHDSTATYTDSGSGFLVNRDGFKTSGANSCTVNGKCDYPYKVTGLVKSTTISVNYGTYTASIDDEAAIATVLTGKLSRPVGEKVTNTSLVMFNGAETGKLAPNSNYTLTVTTAGKLTINKKAVTVNSFDYVLGTGLPESTYIGRKVNAVEYYNAISSQDLGFAVEGIPNNDIVKDCAHESVIIVDTNNVAAQKFSATSCTGDIVFTGKLATTFKDMNTKNPITIGTLELTPHGSENYTFQYVEGGSFVITSIKLTLIVQDTSKIYGQSDTLGQYVVKFKGPGSVLTPEDKVTFFGEGALESGTVYSVKEGELADFKSHFGLKFSRESGGEGKDDVGVHTISLQGSKLGYDISVVTEDGEKPLSSDLFTPTSGKFTVSKKAVHIYAKPFDKIFDNVNAPEPTYYIYDNDISAATRDAFKTGTGLGGSGGLVNATVKVLNGTTGVLIDVVLSDGYGTANSETPNTTIFGTNNVLKRYIKSTETELTEVQLKMAGTTDVKFTQATLDDVTNYSFTAHENTYIISPKAVTITTDTVYKVYGEVDPTFTWTVVNYVSGDTDYLNKFTGTPLRLTADIDKKNAGSDITIVEANGTGYSDGIKVIVNSIGGYDYSITYGSGTQGKLVIVPRPLTVSINETESLFKKVYGTADTNFVQEGYSASATATGTLSEGGVASGDWGLAQGENKSVLGIGLWRYTSAGAKILETDETYQDAGEYELRFLTATINGNYVITYGSTNLVTPDTSYQVSPQKYVITKRAVTINVSGTSATQTIEQNTAGTNTDAIAALKNALTYNTSTFANWSDNVSFRTADKLEGNLCYVSSVANPVENSVCVNPDFTKAGTYYIVRARTGYDIANTFLTVTNTTYGTGYRGVYEDKNYKLTFAFSGSFSEYGTLVISGDQTAAKFFVGNTQNTTTLTYAAVLSATDAKSGGAFHTAVNSPKTGYDNNEVIKGLNESLYSYNLRTRFSLQAYDYYTGQTSGMVQTTEANLRWVCTVMIGETSYGCEETQFKTDIVQKSIVGKYTIKYTVYDGTYTGAVDTGNPASISGDLYIIDTVAPTTGTISAHSDAAGTSTALTTSTWTNVGGVYFKITGGSDDSYDGGAYASATAQWGHRFTLDGGSHWYDYTGESSIIEVLKDTQEGQVTIAIQAYDNRLESGTWTSPTVHSNARPSANVKYFGNGGYTPAESNVYGAMEFGTQVTFTITVDRTAPDLGVVKKEERDRVIVIEVGHTTIDGVAKYKEEGFVPSDSVVVSTDKTTSGSYAIYIASPTSADRLKSCSVVVKTKDGTTVKDVYTATKCGQLTQQELSDLASAIVYESDGIFKEGLYEIHYNAEDQAGNKTSYQRRIIIKDLRPQWFLNLSSTDSGSVEQLKLGNEIQVDAGSQFTIPMFFAVDYQGNQLLNVEISRVITFEGRVVDEIDTSLVGEYIISYNGVGGEHNLAAQTLNLRVTVLPNDDLSSIVVNSNNSFIYMMMVVGLAFIGLSLSYVIIRKKS